jgi:exo-beta-1,3-glucanase (GH17 family)
VTTDDSTTVKKKIQQMIIQGDPDAKILTAPKSIEKCMSESMVFIKDTQHITDIDDDLCKETLANDWVMSQVLPYFDIDGITDNKIKLVRKAESYCALCDRKHENDHAFIQLIRNEQ